VLAGAQVAREGELVGLYDVFTHEPHRNRGLARLLCQHLLAEARAAGPKLDEGDLAEIGELLSTAAPVLTMHPPR